MFLDINEALNLKYCRTAPRPRSSPTGESKMAASVEKNPGIFLSLLLFVVVLYFAVNIQTDTCSLNSTLCMSTVSWRESVPEVIKRFQQGRKQRLSTLNIVLKQTHAKRNKTTLTLLLLVSGDINLNPGPGNGSVFPCGYCELPVTWSRLGVCCTNCSI